MRAGGQLSTFAGATLGLTHCARTGQARRQSTDRVAVCTGSGELDSPQDRADAPSTNRETTR